MRDEVLRYGAGYRQSFSDWLEARNVSPAAAEASVRLVHPVWQTAARLYMDQEEYDTRYVDWGSVVAVDVFAEKQDCCPICLEEKYRAPRVTPCGHVYCWVCILKYLRKAGDEAGVRCPLCQYDVQEEELRLARIQHPAADNLFVLTKRTKTQDARVSVVAAGTGFYLRKMVPFAETELDPTELFLAPFMHLMAMQIVDVEDERAPVARALAQLEVDAKHFGFRVEEHMDGFNRALERHFASPETGGLVSSMVDTFPATVDLSLWRCQLLGGRSAPEEDEKPRSTMSELPYYLVYQHWTGEAKFLSAMTTRVLLKDAFGEVARLPPTLTGECSCVQNVTSGSILARHKHPYLSYLPDGLAVTVGELDVKPYLRNAGFSEEYEAYLADTRRTQQRLTQRRQRMERLYECYVQELAELERDKPQICCNPPAPGDAAEDSDTAFPSLPDTAPKPATPWRNLTSPPPPTNHRQSAFPFLSK